VLGDEVCSCLGIIVEEDLVLEKGNGDSVKSWLAPTQPTPSPTAYPSPTFHFRSFQALGTQGGGMMSLKVADPLL